MTDEQLIKLTKSFVKETLKNAEGSKKLKFEVSS